MFRSSFRPSSGSSCVSC